MTFVASQGGHAPSHLREAFQDWIEDCSGTVTVDDASRPKDWLLGQLWNCTDILPGDACWILGLRPGSTYAQAVRALK